MTKKVPSSTPVVCPFCKRKGHISIKSSKCRHFKPLPIKVGVKKKVPPTPLPSLPKARDDLEDCSLEGKHDNSVNPQVNTTEFVSLKVPKTFTSKYVPVVDVDHPTFTPGDTIFKIAAFENCEDKKHLSPTPEVVVLKFFSCWVDQQDCCQLQHIHQEQDKVR